MGKIEVSAAPEVSTRLWTPANIVTLIRICLVPVFVVVLLSPWPEFLHLPAIATESKSLIAACIFILISCTDWLDGYLARSRGEVTDFGKFMDPLADKILVVAALLALIELGALPSWVALIIVSREFIVSGVRMVSASKGVVIAAGDYAGNPAMVFGLNDEYRNFVEERGLDWTQVVGMMGRTGRGQQLGCWAGGRIWPGPQASMGHANGAGCFGGIALPHFNCDGDRFMNEGILGVWGGYYQELRQPKGVIYGVADANWREFVFKNAPEHVFPGTGGTNDGGFLTTLDEEIPNVAGTGAEGYKIRGCVTYCADTLEELAGYMYPDDADVQAEFLAQVARYNELCEKGADEDFGKDAFLMQSIDTPPFYASVSLHSETFGLGLVELGGLTTDGEQRVLGADDKPIAGLWATGNSCGGRFVGAYHTPIAGISIGWATSMGKLAGEAAAQA